MQMLTLFTCRSDRCENIVDPGILRVHYLHTPTKHENAGSTLLQCVDAGDARHDSLYSIDAHDLITLNVDAQTGEPPRGLVRIRFVSPPSAAATHGLIRYVHISDEVFDLPRALRCTWGRRNRFESNRSHTLTRLIGATPLVSSSKSTLPSLRRPSRSFLARNRSQNTLQRTVRPSGVALFRLRSSSDAAVVGVSWANSPESPTRWCALNFQLLL